MTWLCHGAWFWGELNIISHRHSEQSKEVQSDGPSNIPLCFYSFRRCRRFGLTQVMAVSLAGALQFRISPRSLSWTSKFQKNPPGRKPYNIPHRSIRSLSGVQGDHGSMFRVWGLYIQEAGPKCAFTSGALPCAFFERAWPGTCQDFLSRLSRSCAPLRRVFPTSALSP